jgi:hypothetical protein
MPGEGAVGLATGLVTRSEDLSDPGWIPMEISLALSGCGVIEFRLAELGVDVT